MDVKKSIQDAGYIAVGAGVIGFQQVQVRRHELNTAASRRITETRACVESQATTVRTRLTGRAQDARTRLEDRAAGLTSRATTLTGDVIEWVDPVVVELRVRVEPLVEQLQALPVQVGKAVDAGRTRVRDLVGAAIPTAA